MIRVWDGHEELLGEEPDAPQRERMRAALSEFRAHMAEYPREGLDRWLQLASYITAPVLKRLQVGVGCVRCAVTPLSLGNTKRVVHVHTLIGNV